MVNKKIVSCLLAVIITMAVSIVSMGTAFAATASTTGMDVGRFYFVFDGSGFLDAIDEINAPDMLGINATIVVMNHIELNRPAIINSRNVWIANPSGSVISSGTGTVTLTPLITVNSGSTLTLNEGVILEHTNASNSNAVSAIASFNSDIILIDSTIRSSINGITAASSSVQMRGNSTITGNTSNGVNLTLNSSFVMHDGLITDNGIGVLIYENLLATARSTFTMYDGEISDNTFRGVCARRGSVFNMRNGYIINNRGESGIRAINGAQLNLREGTISGHTTLNHSSGIRVYNNTTIDLFDGFVISNNNSAGIFIQTGTSSIVNMYGGEITNNGEFGIRAGIGAVINLRGGEISNHSSMNHSSGIWALSETVVNLFDGVILRDNRRGVNIQNADFSILNMYGGEIINNDEFGVRAICGNNIQSVQVNLRGGTISESNALTHSSGVRAAGAIVNLSNGFILTNNTRGIEILDDSVLNMEGGEITSGFIVTSEFGIRSDDSVVNLRGGIISGYDSLQGIPATGVRSYRSIVNVYNDIEITNNRRGLNISGGTLNMNGGHIFDNSEFGIRSEIGVPAVLNLSGGVISGHNGVQIHNGVSTGVRVYTNTIVNLRDNIVITDNYRGIHNAGGTVNIYGGEVSESWIGIHSSGTVNMNGGIIDTGEVGVHIFGSGVFSMTNGTITNKERAVVLANNAFFIMTDGNFIGNIINISVRDNATYIIPFPLAMSVVYIELESYAEMFYAFPY